MLWMLSGALALALAATCLWLVGERGHLVLPSTRAAFRERRQLPGHRGNPLTALHGYVYGRWPVQYIKWAMRVVPALPGRAEQWWADRYHGKVLPTELARAIIRLDHDICRTDLERIVPYALARDIVLTASPDIVLLECPCRHARPQPCQPTQVCMVVGGGAFTLEHHPSRSHRVTQDEALALLEAEHERGHVHTAYFKDACGDRFYAICNCCKCCCGGLEAMTRRGIPMVASSGYVAEVEEALCIGCGDCATACPFEAVTVPYRAMVTWEKCMGCGVCEGQCATEAIRLVLDERKGLPLDVRTLGAPAETVLA